MVTLRTLKAVLAVDLGLSTVAIARCLADAAPILAETADTDTIPIADALRIVAMAEDLVVAA